MVGRILAATLLLTLVACGGSPTAAPEAGRSGGANGKINLKSTFGPVFEKVEGLSGKERRDVLVSLAEKEGDVKWYTSLNVEVARSVIEAYEKATGLGVSLYRAGSENVRNRVLEEAGAGFAGADVVETNGPELVALADQSVLEPLKSPVQDALTDGAVREEWTATRFNIFTVAWNTDLVPEGKRPTSYEDLADPAWDGRMAMEIEDYDWYWALWHHLVDEKGMSEKEVDAYFQDLAKGAAFTTGHTTMRQLLAAGEYALVTSDYSYGIAEEVAKGAPVAWEPPIQPLFARPNGIALVRNAENPAAALAFTEWLLSDGQKVLADNNIDPTRKDLLNVDAEMRVIDVAKYLAEEDKFKREYEELARLGKRIEK
jgi:iron(III) transport system substrate-binding protein